MTQVTTEKLYQHRQKLRVLRFDVCNSTQSHSPALFCQFTVMSHLLTALSSTFPIGEQFFVHSVRNVRDQVKDENLQAQIAAFIGQEAIHFSNTAFNAAWRRDDYNLDRFQAWLARKDDYVKTCILKFSSQSPALLRAFYGTF